jgi:hypothetical protein
MAVTAINPRPRCPVCKSPYKDQIHALKLAKMTLQDLHIETQRLGRGIKRETLGKHFRICLNGEPPLVSSQSLADAGKNAQSQAEVDFAMMVQREATALLQAGQLRITAHHGLQAQALLDRRLEKQADRELALNMARLLSGAVVMAPATVIEGRAVEVSSPELPDGLAPDGVYEPVDA